MAKTPAQAALDRAVAVGLGPALAQGGYRKSGHTFRRTAERSVQVVNLQASQGSSADIVKFTMNLGVFFPEVHEVAIDLLRYQPSPAGPTESQCTVRTRIGRLLPGGLDHWWRLGDGDPPEPIGRELEAAYQDHARPWLTTMADFESARRTGAQFTGPAMDAAFALAAGDRAEAGRILTAFLAQRPQATALSAWGHKLGLITEG